MVVIVDFNAIIFIILLVANIMLCIVKVPILGLALGFLTIALTGAVFINDALINVFFSYVLIVVAFSSMIINGLEAKGLRRKK